jgi:hypothetical protein
MAQCYERLRLRVTFLDQRGDRFTQRFVGVRRRRRQVRGCDGDCAAGGDELWCAVISQATNAATSKVIATPIDDPGQ